jgi:hypothetical protein
LGSSCLSFPSAGIAGVCNLIQLVSYTSHSIWISVSQGTMTLATRASPCPMNMAGGDWRCRKDKR